jgi:ABC-type phosphate transport system auxiliary subunit
VEDSKDALPMNVLQRQSYKLYFNWLANKLIDWYDNKPANKDLKNCIKAIEHIGLHNNNLQIENDINTKLVSKLRADRNRTVLRARKSEEQVEKLEKEIEDLKLKLKIGL